MPIIRLRAGLRELAGDAGDHQVSGDTAAAAISSLEHRHPRLGGFLRDERGELRRHIALFINGAPAGLDTPLGDGDILDVLPALSGGSDTIELLVGSRKGLVVLRGQRHGELEIAARVFAGNEVAYAVRDPSTGRYLAAVNASHHGPRVWLADDPAGPWQPSDGPCLPQESGAAVERVWVVEPGAAPGEVWAGVDPPALFRSADGGSTWALNRPLWDQPSRPHWPAGAGGRMVHSICPWPGDPNRLAVGVSAGGIWLTDDGGQHWRPGNRGLVARYLPDGAQPTHEFCIHHIERSPVAPATLYMQFHGGVYRSDDAGGSWTSIADRLPADFGFVIVTDPRDAARAWVIPLVADVDRVPPDARLRVYETTDRGQTWTPRTAGLPQRGAYQVVLRQAFCHDRNDPLGLWFGASNGEVYGSLDAGKTWRLVAAHLPAITSVRVA